MLGTVSILDTVCEEPKEIKCSKQDCGKSFCANQIHIWWNETTAVEWLPGHDCSHFDKDKTLRKKLQVGSTPAPKESWVFEGQEYTDENGSKNELLVFCPAIIMGIRCGLGIFKVAGSCNHTNCGKATHEGARVKMKKNQGCGFEFCNECLAPWKGHDYDCKAKDRRSNAYIFQHRDEYTVDTTDSTFLSRLIDTDRAFVDRQTIQNTIVHIINIAIALVNIIIMIRFCRNKDCKLNSGTFWGGNESGGVFNCCMKDKLLTIGFRIGLMLFALLAMVLNMATINVNEDIQPVISTEWTESKSETTWVMHRRNMVIAASIPILIYASFKGGMVYNIVVSLVLLVIGALKLTLL